jgi:uncharacterized protein
MDARDSHSTPSDSRAAPPPHTVTIRHDVRIPTRDGLELSANLFLPVASPERPVERFPAIMEMLPYRKDDWHYAADDVLGTYLAERGFALCRLDVRGTGSSQGIAEDEYTEAETFDGYDAVEWLSVQPWCNGNVGMWGISYGGFAAIQVAALRPPHLRAIVPMYATDDRYTDDVHYIGGCMTVSELSQYAVSQVAMNAMPPDPGYTGSGWKTRWRDRLEATPVWLFEWARQQRDGPYWRRGSLAPGYDRITAAILHIGGWRDSYVDPVFRMQERCVNAPRRSIVGDWVHSFPDTAYPGPRIDWRHELVRFFDHWLRGADNGVMDGPGLTYFRREYTEPAAFPAASNGSWQAEAGWPVARTEARELYLAPGEATGEGRLVAEPPDDESVARYVHRPTMGTRASLSWGCGHAPNGLPRDLRPDEAWGPTWTSEALPASLDILGFPEAVLHLASSAPVAHVVVRLTDVAPDGTSAQVSAGILNLTHRDSHRAPRPLDPGRVCEVHVPLRAAGYRFLAGHRIRLSVASAYWPVIWPSPFPAQNEVHQGAVTPSRLVLPILPSPSPLAPSTFAAPVPLPQVGEERDEPAVWRIIEDVIEGSLTVTTYEAGTIVLPDGRTSLFVSEGLEMTAYERDPGHALFRNECVYRLSGEASAAAGEVETETGAEAADAIEIVATGTSRATPTDIEMDVQLTVRLGGRPFFDRTQRETIARDLM